ncbi:DUF3438 family protein [Enterobacter cloacae]
MSHLQRYVSIPAINKHLRLSETTKTIHLRGIIWSVELPTVFLAYSGSNHTHNTRNFFRTMILSSGITADALELLRWERIPLPVALHVSQERLVFVDKNVEVSFPAALEGNIQTKPWQQQIAILEAVNYTTVEQPRPHPSGLQALCPKCTPEFILIHFNRSQSIP